VISVATPSPTRSGSGPTDAVLVFAARAGEAWAQEALFRRYAPLVNGLAFRLLGGDSDLDDIIQESFAEALSSLSRLRNTETFPAWLSSIVVRTTNKFLRRRRLMTRLGLRRSQPVDLDALTSRTIPPDAAFELGILYRLVETMPEKLRTPLLLRHLEDASLEDIGRLLGISLATVKRRLNAGQAELGAALARAERGARVHARG
jgi:RNA polymerase sigma-70 factor (ECF subfamily)